MKKKEVTKSGEIRPNLNPKTTTIGNSLVVQWLGLRTFAASRVQSLVREIRSRKLHGAVKKKKKSTIYTYC